MKKLIYIAVILLLCFGVITFVFNDKRKKEKWIDQFENTISVIDTIYGSTYIITVDTTNSNIVDIQKFKIKEEAK